MLFQETRMVEGTLCKEIGEENKELCFDDGVVLREPNMVYITEAGDRLATDDDGKEFCRNGKELCNNRFKIDGNIIETDDNGTRYKENGRLLPNVEYVINGYVYRTDNRMEAIGNGDQASTDERGHLIGDRFDGSNKLENLVPMDANLNRGDFKSLEDKLATAVAAGEGVEIDVRDDNQSNMPVEFVRENTKNCPVDGNNGHWDGERGNSTWYPDRDYIPPHEGIANYKNPDDLTWGQILDKYGIDGTDFKDGEPDFRKVSKGTVEIEGFITGGTEAIKSNFAKADIELAKQKGCSPEDVAKWRKKNNYTWHECKDMKTMQKVPHEIHANVPHSGGRSQNKEGMIS